MVLCVMSTCTVDRHKLLCNTLFATPNFHLSSVGGGCHWLQLALVVIFMQPLALALHTHAHGSITLCNYGGGGCI